MSLWIESSCINCDMCAPECPNQAIAYDGKQYQIDDSLCTECAGFYDRPACVEVCPLDCIEALPSV
ncbi:YfhL family 4Fe-4S dicluster ferredoxin [Rheinheimera marina]|uniref:YfhL family 4Fe-4S dicluster ferredoxin n=1 Tax=Rheinheimera marina TaxID=1774958 RepID=A0ABV9JP15_9GAMM